jgi:hypothetical protein
MPSHIKVDAFHLADGSATADPRKAKPSPKTQLLSVFAGGGHKSQTAGRRNHPGDYRSVV